jgi:hypothetical protein
VLFVGGKEKGMDPIIGFKMDPEPSAGATRQAGNREKNPVYLVDPVRENKNKNPFQK